MTRPHITRQDGQIRLTYTAPMLTVILSDEQARDLREELTAAMDAPQTMDKQYLEDTMMSTETTNGNTNGQEWGDWQELSNGLISQRLVGRMTISKFGFGDPEHRMVCTGRRRFAVDVHVSGDAEADRVATKLDALIDAFEDAVMATGDE